MHASSVGWIGGHFEWFTGIGGYFEQANSSYPLKLGSFGKKDTMVRGHSFGNPEVDYQKIDLHFLGIDPWTMKKWGGLTTLDCTHWNMGHILADFGKGHWLARYVPFGSEGWDNFRLSGRMHRKVHIGEPTC